MTLSRTRFALLTAFGLVVLSAAVHVTRRETGGADVGGPPGASSWEVTITARGSLQAEKHSGVLTSLPPDFRHQHVFDPSGQSNELAHRGGRAEATKGFHDREVLWARRPGIKSNTDYRLTYSFKCVLGTHHPTHGMTELTRQLDAAPGPDALASAPRVESDHPAIAALARDLAGDKTSKTDQVRAFANYLADVPYAETDGTQTAWQCLEAGGGDDAGRSRLLVALCRSREIPARVVTGLVLHPDAPPALHRWAEAWVRSEDGPEGHWLPVDPTYGHFGARKWPTNFLVVRLDDEPLVRSPGQGEPKVGLFARPIPNRPPADETRIHAFWRVTSFAGLPPAEQVLARFLVLLPLGALVVSVFRVVIGVRTFGVFAPALLGLIFRDLTALPWGLGIFTATVLVGWLFRRILDRYHLLLIPRTAVLLTLVIMFLLGVVLVAARAGVTVTGYVALFPLIILTNMVERFWTMEAEDGTRSSLRTLAGTVLVAVAVAFAVSPEAVARWLFRFPETLGVVIAAQLLLGRYTGYRLTELYRFQDVIEMKDERKPPVAEAAPVPVTEPSPLMETTPVGEGKT
jgi:transglutaminase-like putative cysteine protease